VPVPSSAAARRRRGDTPLTALAAGVAHGFGRHELVLADALKREGQTSQADQVVKNVVEIARAARLTDVLANVGGDTSSGGR